MSKFRLFKLLILVFVSSLSLAQIADPSFEESVTDRSSRVKSTWDQYKDQTFNKLIADIYQQRSPSKMVYNAEPLIPKIMHQIWIGSSPLPPLYKNYLEECKLLHPDWEFKLWQNADIEQLNLQYKHVYDLARTWIQKSDVLRYEILLKYGGVYRDTDIKCYRPLDELNHKYDFYAASEFILYKLGGNLQINNGFIGASSEHPIIKNTLDIIASNLPQQLQLYDNGDESNRNYEDISWFILKTTMYPLREAIHKELLNDQKAIILPTTYEFSCIKHDLYKVNEENSLFNFIKIATGQNIQDKFPFAGVKHESFILHNVAKSEAGFLTFAQGMDMEIPARKKLLMKLPPADKHILDSLEYYYASNAPKLLPFKVQDEIPKKIIFVIFNEQEKNDLANNMHDWIMLNRNFIIEIWDLNKISELLPTIKKYLTEQQHSSEELRFLSGLELINRFGGHYADAKAKPIAPLFELGNKYKLYAGLQPVNQQNLQLLASQKLIGSVAASPIISKVLEDFYQQNTSISQSLIKTIYQNMWLYGKIVILPTAAIGPADPYITKGFFNKMINIYTNYKSFIDDRHCSYAIIE
ncbi:glycosyltransferase [Candidatus Trichorickettsia mobilis]|uniref:glycosyltransferase n=1 Tax=Candidatus Trichorickettsia mobilis TaxID=1346319 RepID=UPI00292EB438|nr:glycosyltransferase [Candidatus Trichorickettsia mobilis]